MNTKKNLLYTTFHDDAGNQCIIIDIDQYQNCLILSKYNNIICSLKVEQVNSYINSSVFKVNYIEFDCLLKVAFVTNLYKYYENNTVLKGYLDKCLKHLKFKQKQYLLSMNGIYGKSTIQNSKIEEIPNKILTKNNFLGSSFIDCNDQVRNSLFEGYTDNDLLI